MSTMGLVTTLPSATNTANLNLDFINQKYSINNASKTFAEMFSMARNTTATYFGKDGLIKTAAANVPRFEYDPLTGLPAGLFLEETRSNLSNYSQTFSNATWANNATSLFQNSAIAPDGTMTADKLVEDTSTGNHSTTRSFSATVSTTYTWSVFVKAAERTFAMVQFGNFANQVASNAVWVNLLTGAFTSSDATRTKVQVLPNGWFRISTTVTTTATGNSLIPSIYSGAVMGATSYVGDGTSGIYIWGGQVEAGPFSTSYIPTPATFTSRASIATYYDSKGVLKTAASGAARDAAYAWAAGVLKPIGLLTESASTNMALRSTEFDNASWAKSQVTVVANSALAPDGTMAMDLIVPTTTLGNHQISQTYSSPASATYTLSVYVKAGGYNFARLRASDSVGFITDALVDLVGGTIYNPGPTTKLDSLGNGVYRVSLTATTAATATSVSLGVWPYDNTRTASFSGDGTSGIYAWGAQVEAGAAVTSFIPTTTAAVTRAADVVASTTATRAGDFTSVDLNNSWFNANEYTIFSESKAALPALLSSNRVYELSSSWDNNNRVGMLYLQDTLLGRLQVITAGANVATLTSASVGVNEVMKAAIAAKVNDFAASYNGAAVSTDTSGAMPTNMDKMYIGVFRTGGNQPNGYIRNIQVYNRRLPNNLLQVLSS